MVRDALVDVAYDEADAAEFDAGPQAPRPAGMEAALLGRAVEAGRIIIAVYFLAGAGVLVADGFAGVFVAALLWSLALYFAAAVAIAVAIRRRHRFASSGRWWPGEPRPY